MSTPTQTIEELATREYKYGFVTDIEAEAVPAGLSEDIVRTISAKKNEPQWLLEWRLKAYRTWQTMTEPAWHNVRYGPIDYQKIIYYSAPKPKPSLKSLEEVDPEILKTFAKLGIPLDEQKMLSGVAVDAVFDSVSVATTFKAKLAQVGVIFCSFSDAVQNHPDLVRTYLGSVVPYSDNFFAALNAAVFSDGSFAFIPKCAVPDGASTYFRINRRARPVRAHPLVAEEASVSYLEGCTRRCATSTSPMPRSSSSWPWTTPPSSTDDSELVSRRPRRQGGIYNFVTKRAPASGSTPRLPGRRSRQGRRLPEVPELHPAGRQLDRRVLPVATTNNHQQADTGTKMIHLGKNTRARSSPGHLGWRGQNTYAAWFGSPTGDGARNYSQCDSAHRRQVRGTYVPLPEIKEHDGEGRARGVHVEDRRGSDLLLPSARTGRRGRGQPDRQRLLQGGLP